MALKQIDIVTTLAINLIHYVSSDHILSCDANSLDTSCRGDHQICNLTSSLCYCEKGFVMVGDECEVPSDDSLASHGSTYVVVIVFTIALVICGLVLVIRKYNLIEYMRQKINMYRNNDVIYEDVMIGNDDPPLSP
ncbi:uncharacterized protein LOC115441999 [Manduca sexta]|uniref:uncharacterized protein LOC115441999 n=1 Tax=Manduca sexta TaxID=7130 RepID=UPI0011820547|nr:uncharacterized protein LOC115441999 [Manduca sexta]